MESTINQRIAALIRALGLSRNSFGKSIGRSATTFNSIVDGKTKPSFDVLEEILEKYPKVSTVWLLKGQGPMFLEQEPEQPAESPSQYLIDYLKQLEQNLLSQLAVKDGQIAGLQRTVDYLMTAKLEGVTIKKTTTEHRLNSLALAS